jgi:NAD(P)-dependent dehydrogenase (short-subunit alcohol dehydrogenase family)
MKLKARQVAVVTGGGAGIGFALAEELARRGLSIVLADIHPGSLAEASEKIRALGVEVLPVTVDVTDPEAVNDLASRTLDRFGRVDLICNNAGTAGQNMPTWDFERVEWEWILAVDFWGVLHGVSAFVPHLVSQGSGHVLNVSSMAGISTVPLNGPYNVAKHAVIALSDTLAADLKALEVPVGVTVLCPGPTVTRLLKEGPRPRPEKYRPVKDAGVSPLDNPNTFASTAAELARADDVAKAALEAVEDDRFLLAPHPGSRARVEDWTRRLLEGAHA